MFSSDNDDDKKTKRSFWPWNRRAKKELSEQQIDSTSETSVDDDAVLTDHSGLSEKSQPTDNQSVHQAHQSELTHQANTSSDQTTQTIVTNKVLHIEESLTDPDPLPVEPETDNKESFLSRMFRGLGKTRNVLVEGVEQLLLGKKEIDDDLLENLETQLLIADVGVEATSEIIENLTGKVKYKELDNADAIMSALKCELTEILEPVDRPLVIPQQNKPFVILVVGVNGVGKTTTIGKLARMFKSQEVKVMLAAGDTFRAAAVEQLQVWGARNNIPVIAQHTGADSASVIFDAYEAAKARNMDVLIADTAGRLHNKEHLMDELKKVKRVLGKVNSDANQQEVLLVLDAATGQNALSQAKLFHEAVELTGIVLTKMDGTAKGGVIFALSKQLQIPIRFLGVGEQLDDLQPFSAKAFVSALFAREG